MSMSPATWARARPSSPGAQTRRRTAIGERTTSTGAPAGPASDPSQVRSRQGSSWAPRTVLIAAARRAATVARSATTCLPPLGPSGGARPEEAVRARPETVAPVNLEPRRGPVGGVLPRSGAPARVLDVVLDQSDRGDPVH